jgi:hypothetical protein
MSPMPNRVAKASVIQFWAFDAASRTLARLMSWASRDPHSQYIGLAMTSFTPT